LQIFYVSYRRPGGNGRPWIVGAGVGIALAVLGVVLSKIAPPPTWLAPMPMVQGLIMGAGLLYIGHRLGLTRFYVLAFLSALIGVVVLLSLTGNSPDLYWVVLP